MATLTIDPIANVDFTIAHTEPQGLVITGAGAARALLELHHADGSLAFGGTWASNLPSDPNVTTWDAWETPTYLQVQPPGQYQIAVLLPNNQYAYSNFFTIDPRTLHATAAQIEAMTPAQLDADAHNTSPTAAAYGYNPGLDHLVATDHAKVDLDIEQIKVLEADGITVASQHGAKIELSDSAQEVLSLLKGATWADVMNNISKLQDTGVTDVAVQLPHHHVLEVSVATLSQEMQGWDAMGPHWNGLWHSPQCAHNDSWHWEPHIQHQGHWEQHLLHYGYWG